jgi:hypothetical protein
MKDRKVFVVEGRFVAEDVDDAFRVLAEHFASLAERGTDGGHEGVLKMSVYPDSQGPG